MLLGSPVIIDVSADWKVIVEQWLETATQRSVPELAADSFAWTVAPFAAGGWSAARYLNLVECQADRTLRRQFIFPNQLLESRPDGLSVLQVLPVEAGHSVLRRLDYTVLPPDDSARAAQYLARRLAPYTRPGIVKMAESMQKGMAEFGYGRSGGASISPAVASFRGRLAARIPLVLRDRAPNGV